MCVLASLGLRDYTFFLSKRDFTRETRIKNCVCILLNRLKLLCVMKISTYTSCFIRGIIALLRQAVLASGKISYADVHVHVHTKHACTGTCAVYIHAYVCVHVHMLIEYPEILHVVLLQIYFINSLIYTVIHFTMISI